MTEYIPGQFFNNTYQNMTDMLPKGTTDIDIINHYCNHYIRFLPYNTILVILGLTIIAIFLYNRDHPNFIGFLKMTAFIIIALGIINIVVLAIAI